MRYNTRFNFEADMDALIIVDVQNDFCPGGTVPVTEGDQVVPVLNRYIEKFKTAGLTIVATRDWHPEWTSHFKNFGGVWPSHCVRGSKGAYFHPELKLPEDAKIVSKGVALDEDGYSGFQGTDTKGVSLADILRQRNVERIIVGGLATDYCVKHTVLDGLKEGFRVVVLDDAIRGVDLQPGDSERAIVEMIRSGAEKAKDFSPLSA